MISAGEVWREFESLKPTLDSSAASAIKCGNQKQHLLVKGEGGEPVLLIASVRRNAPRAPIRLKHVRIAFDTLYEINVPDTGEITTGYFCRIGCASESPSLYHYFVELMAVTAERISHKASQIEIDDLIAALLEMFKVLALPPKQTVTGLWGELLLIFAASNPESFINAWHSEHTDTFDFSFDSYRLEVKSTERQTRDHEFSLSQVRSGCDNDIIVSVFLMRSASGKTILDLTKSIAAKVPRKHQEKLWRLVIEGLGENIDGSNDFAFDEIEAVKEIICLPALLVASPFIKPEDEGIISDVRFRSNISLIDKNLRLPNVNLLMN